MKATFVPQLIEMLLIEHATLNEPMFFCLGFKVIKNKLTVQIILIQLQ